MTADAARKRLPRRDFFILPFLIFITILVVLAVAELGARYAMPAAEADSCMIADPVLGAHAKANCTSRTKSPEGEWVQNSYNDCGYRSDTPCHAPLNGAWRIAVIGSSTSWGFKIPTEQTWYTHTAAFFTARCARRIDVQNLAGIYKFDQTAATLPAALAEHPKVVVMFIAPFDLEEVPPGDFRPATAQAVRTGYVRKGILAKVKEIVGQSRTTTLAEHFIFRQPATYISLYLRNGDEADFLRQPFTPAWQRRIAYADAALGYIADKLHDAGVPLILVFAPQQAQADLVSTGEHLPGVDPYAIDLALKQIAQRHGILYADTLPRFQSIPDTPDYFMNVDGHLNGKGQALAASVLEDELASPGNPFDSCRLNEKATQ